MLIFHLYKCFYNIYQPSCDNISDLETNFFERTRFKNVHSLGLLDRQIHNGLARTNHCSNYQLYHSLFYGWTLKHSWSVFYFFVDIYFDRLICKCSGIIDWICHLRCKICGGSRTTYIITSDTFLRVF